MVALTTDALRDTHDDANDEVASDGKPRSLAPVLKVIPKECYDNPTWKGLAYFARDSLLWVAALVGLFMTDVWWQVLGLWIVAGFIVCGLFVIGHDAAHGALFKSKRMNSWIAHLAMLPSLHVVEGWIYGHNKVHHGHTARENFDFVWHPRKKEWWDQMTPWQKFQTRIEWSAFGSGLYYGREIWWQRIMNWVPPTKYAPAVKRDRALVWGFIVGFSALLAGLGYMHYGTALGGAWMVFKLFVVPFYVFTHMIGWTVYVHHIHPDIKWYAKKEWNPYLGQMEATTVWGVGPILNFFWHNIFVHVPHHVDMRIPFYHLPAAANAIKAHFPVRETVLSPSEYIRSTRECKIYNFETSAWEPYPD